MLSLSAGVGSTYSPLGVGPGAPHHHQPQASAVDCLSASPLVARNFVASCCCAAIRVLIARLSASRLRWGCRRICWSAMVLSSAPFAGSMQVASVFWYSGWRRGDPGESFLETPHHTCSVSCLAWRGSCTIANTSLANNDRGLSTCTQKMFWEPS